MSAMEINRGYSNFINYFNLTGDADKIENLSPRSREKLVTKAQEFFEELKETSDPTLKEKYSKEFTRIINDSNKKETGASAKLGRLFKYAVGAGLSQIETKRELAVIGFAIKERKL